jgi:hypothetical protein
LACPKHGLGNELHTVCHSFQHFSLVKKFKQEDVVLLSITNYLHETTEKMLPTFLNADCSCDEIPSSDESAPSWVSDSSNVYPTLDDLTEHLHHFLPSRQRLI